MRNYYEILEISQKASDEVIKMAYKALVKKYHPDVFGGNPDFANHKMKEINEAYNILSNLDKRKEYDVNLATWKAYQEPHYKQNGYNRDHQSRNMMEDEDDNEEHEKDDDSIGCLGKLMSLAFVIFIVPFGVYSLIKKLLWFIKDKQSRDGIAITLTIILFAALILWFIKKYLQ